MDLGHAHSGQGCDRSRDVTPDLGVVVIGRNEGNRLRACLESAKALTAHVVYVDSASTDTSLAIARERNVSVVALDASAPQSAARGRNAGFHHLRQQVPGLKLVQFVDGDCRLVDGWMASARQRLDERPDLAIVCGQLREWNADGSIYNRLCDMDWNGATGEIEACGGVFVIRAHVFSELGGMREELIAGEEREFCQRVRRTGWKIERIAQQMAWHDADIQHFRQWFRRCVRTGYAYAIDKTLEDGSTGRPCTHHVRRNWLWGLFLPSLVVATSWISGGWSLLLLTAYAVMAIRIAMRRMRRGDHARDALLYGIFTMLAKVPAALGQLRFAFDQWRGTHGRLIEYK